MIAVELGFLIDIDMCYLLPDDQQIKNEGCFHILKSKNKIYGILLLPQTIVTENTKKAQIIYF